MKKTEVKPAQEPKSRAYKFAAASKEKREAWLKKASSEEVLTMLKALSSIELRNECQSELNKRAK